MPGDFARFAKSLEATGATIDAAVTAAAAEATALVTAAALRGQGQAGASSGRLRGVGRNGAAIGVRGTVRKRTGLVAATGPAWLLDHDTHNKGGGVRTVGKLYFEKAVEETAPLLPGIFDAHLGVAMVQAVR